MALTMDDKIDRICDKLGVSREEALFYLKACRWDLDAATEACRSKTVPTPPLTLQPLSEEEQRITQNIAMFCVVAIGATVADARFYLSRKNWHLHAALGDYLDEFLTTALQSSPQMVAGNDLMQGVLSTVPQRGGMIRDEGNDLMQGVLSTVPQPGVMIRDSSSFSRTEDDTRETLDDEVKMKRIKQFVDAAAGASLDAAVECLEIHNWDVAVALDYFTRDGHSRIEPQEEDVTLCRRCQVFSGTIQEIEVHLMSCNVDTRRTSDGVRGRVVRYGVDEESSESFQCAACLNIFSNKEALKFHEKMCKIISYEPVFNFPRRQRSDRRQRYLHFPRRQRSARRPFQRIFHFPRRQRSARRQQVQGIQQFLHRMANRVVRENDFSGLHVLAEQAARLSDNDNVGEEGAQEQLSTANQTVRDTHNP